ncbi:MAG: hypothetical protein ACJ8FS_16330 [Sphingomicrobium sp.]
MIQIIPARPTHIGPIATRMREIDKLECAVFGHSPKNALRAGLMSASLAWTALVNGRPEAMFGVSTVSLLDNEGRPWMLMTDEAMRHSVALVRFGRVYTEAIQRHYAILQNWVHAENAVSIRWLSRLGFAVGSVDVINGQPMRVFARCRSILPFAIL